MDAERQPSHIGRYRVLHEIGRGGMGVVFAAYDPDLGREIAIKCLHRGAEPAERERLRREARAAAGVSHPGICQLYEIAEADGELFIAMELVDGAPLAAGLAGGPLAPREARAIAAAVLHALEAVHARGIVHRDLKPSNVIVTPHGVKLVDFGLARAQTAAADVTAAVTLPGAVIGTPRYMAPEQIEGRVVDARADLFAVGCLLFEMLAGRPAFPGRTIAEVIHEVMFEHPAVLTGSPTVAALDRIIHRAVAKSLHDRYETAQAMLADLDALDSADWSSQATPVVRPMTRLIVAPFRLLRADPEVDFLAFGLADAVATSLAGLQSLVVRSTAAAGAEAGGAPDLKKIAEAADVDVVLLGSILRAGNQLRVVSQLVEAPGGTVVWSHTAQVAMGDIFQLQDDLTHRIVESLSVPLSAREQRLLRHDVPATARAYEFYLRANQLALHIESWTLARDVYRQCLDEDARYAPAWARLGRVARVLAKYAAAEPQVVEWQREAQDALQRALDLNPDLPLAHYLTAQVEIDRGDGERAMVRLVERLIQTADSQLFAGLVQACRYCGLLEMSLEAHEQARRLDKGQVTTVMHTLWSVGAYARAYEETVNETLGYLPPTLLVAMGRSDEAIAYLRQAEVNPRHPALSTWYAPLRGALTGADDEAVQACERIVALNVPDPEATYHMARTLAYCKRSSRALDLFSRTVDEGYFNVALFERDPWVDSLRGEVRFTAALDRARMRQSQAREAFDRAGGRRLFALARPAG